MQQWSLQVEDQRERVEVVPVLIKLWDLPKELWGDDDAISLAASLVGELYAMDENTARRRRLDFARVCVFIKADQELQTIIPVDVGRHIQFKVEYQWCQLLANTAKSLAIA